MPESITPEALPAWATTVTHVIATCTACGKPITDDGEAIIFDTPAEAAEHVTEYEDGRVEGDTLTCGACVSQAACEAAGGHDIQTATHSTRPGLYWYCGRYRCPAHGMIRSDTEPGGHDGC